MTGEKNMKEIMVAMITIKNSAMNRKLLLYFSFIVILFNYTINVLF